MFQLAVDQEISVRTLHPDDTPEFFELLERNRARLRPWIHPSSLPETAQAARRFTIECYFGSLDPLDASDTPYIDEVQPYYPPSSPAMEMGIWVNGTLAGEIALSLLSHSPMVAEFGYWISGEQQQRGIITRCVSSLMEYAIDNMHVERFVIGCAVGNRRSRAVPERLGYHLDSTVPGGEVVGEFVYDRVVYGIGSSEWRVQKKVAVQNG